MAIPSQRYNTEKLFLYNTIKYCTEISLQFFTMSSYYTNLKEGKGESILVQTIYLRGTSYHQDVKVDVNKKL